MHIAHHRLRWSLKLTYFYEEGGLQSCLVKPCKLYAVQDLLALNICKSDCVTALFLLRSNSRGGQISIGNRPVVQVISANSLCSC